MAGSINRLVVASLPTSSSTSPLPPKKATLYFHLGGLQGVFMLVVEMYMLPSGIEHFLFDHSNLCSFHQRQRSLIGKELHFRGQRGDHNISFLFLKSPTITIDRVEMEATSEMIRVGFLRRVREATTRRMDLAATQM